MGLKKLSQFVTFDLAGFLQGKTIMCVGTAEWLDFTTKAHNGIKVESVIIKDDTAYNQKDGEAVNNLYEKITFKCKKDVRIPVNAIIRPVNGVAVAYGPKDSSYVNQLSVTCDDIQIVSQAQKKEV